jgi:hypothetical protein
MVRYALYLLILKFGLMRKAILGMILSFSFFICGAATRTWTGSGAGGAGTDFNAAANWSGSGALLATDDLIINLTINVSSTITLSANASVNSITITSTVPGSGGAGKFCTFSLSGFTLSTAGNFTVTNSATGGNSNRVYIIDMLIGSGGILNIGGNLAATITSTSSASNYLYIENSGAVNVTGTTLAKSLNNGVSSTIFFLVDNSPAAFTFTGDATFDDGTSVANNAVLLGTITNAATGKFTFKGNVSLGDKAGTYTITTFTGATVLFDGTGAQTLTFNNSAYYFNMPNTIIGSTNNPTVTIAGSVTPDNITGDLTLNGSSILDVNTRQLNRNSNGGNFYLKSTSQIKLAATSSIANNGTATLITGSNFPAGFSSYSIDSTSTVELNGAAQTVPATATLTGSLGYGNLTLTSNTKVLGGNINVYRNFTLSTSSSALNLSSYDVTLKSNSQTTAAVAQITNANPFNSYAGTGRFVVERYVASGRKWRFLAVPTDDAARTFRQSWQEGAASSASNPVAGYGMQITDNSGTWSANGFDDYSISGPSVKYWNGAGYTGITSTSAIMKSTKGYMCYIRGDRTALPSGTSVAATTLRTRGQLYAGSQTAIPVTAGATVSIANPYASAIDLRNLTYSGLAGGPAFYVWDPKLTGTYGLGGYQTLSLFGGNFIVIPGGGSYGSFGSAQNYIQSGQAFFVIGGAGGNVTFTEAAKASGSSQIFRTANGTEQILFANLFLKTGTERELVDGAAVFTDASYSNDADGDDAIKMAGTSERVSFLKNGKQLSIERRQDFIRDDTLFLNIGNVKVHEYSWKINFSEIDLHGGTAFLIDKFAGTTTFLSLSDTNTIDFSIANIPGSYAADRFMIVLKPAAVVPVSFVSVSASRSNDKTVSVRWNIENELNILSYDVEYSEDGRNFTGIATKPATGAGAYSLDHTGASAGNIYYRIKATENSGRIIYSSIVKVNGMNDDASIAVYPNPVEGKQIHLSFLKQQKGDYNVQLINAAGQNVFNTIISVNAENQRSAVQLKHIAAGNYKLIISKEESVISSISVFIK